MRIGFSFTKSVEKRASQLCKSFARKVVFKIGRVARGPPPHPWQPRSLASHDHLRPPDQIRHRQRPPADHGTRTAAKRRLFCGGSHGAARSGPERSKTHMHGRSACHSCPAVHLGGLGAAGCAAAAPSSTPCCIAITAGRTPLGPLQVSAGSTTSYPCLLYTSPSPRDGLLSRMPSSA